jgi:hypothetical protein
VADNPLQDTPDREARIRERAYLLWEEDGCPHGREHEFWERAKELLAIEDNPTAGQLPNPITHPDPIPGVTVEEAEIQQNYGETPDRFTDQGDRQETPTPRARTRRTRKRDA